MEQHRVWLIPGVGLSGRSSGCVCIWDRSKHRHRLDAIYLPLWKSSSALTICQIILCLAHYPFLMLGRSTLVQNSQAPGISALWYGAKWILWKAAVWNKLLCRAQTGVSCRAQTTKEERDLYLTSGDIRRKHTEARSPNRLVLAGMVRRFLCFSLYKKSNQTPSPRPGSFTSDGRLSHGSVVCPTARSSVPLLYSFPLLYSCKGDSSLALCFPLASSSVYKITAASAWLTGTHTLNTNQDLYLNLL